MLTMNVKLTIYIHCEWILSQRSCALGDQMNRQECAYLVRVLALTALLVANGLSAEARRAPSAQLVLDGCQEIPADAFLIDPEFASSLTPTAQRHFSERLEDFSEAPLNCREIVMLGDSLTELHVWNEAVANNLVLRNRGISWDTSDGLLLRLDEIIAIRPRAVFLLIGTNDLWSGNSPETTASNILKIADRIRTQSPGSLIFVQTIFPVTGAPLNWGAAPNKKVRTINALLKSESDKAGYTLLDTYALMVDRNGFLNAAYTTDGVHLNERGYDVWSALVSDALARHGLWKQTP